MKISGIRAPPEVTSLCNCSATSSGRWQAGNCSHFVLVSLERSGESEMAQRGGHADLPLHHGKVPEWLAGRMAKLGAIIAEAIVQDYGRDEFLARLAHPFWFQSFGA